MHVPTKEEIDAALGLATQDRVPLPVEVIQKIQMEADAFVEDERMARAKARKVMIATPSMRDPVIQYTVALIGTAQFFNHHGIEFGIEFVVGSSNLPRARNNLAARFLASDCDTLVMIDDDMGWKPADLFRLLASDKPYIAAVGRKRVDAPGPDGPEIWCAVPKPGAPNVDDFGALEVLRVGAAFIRLDRVVFETLVQQHPEWKRPPLDDMTPKQGENYYQFFRFETDAGDEIGEDYLFCDRWREAGGQIWVDPAVELEHVGSKAFKGRLLDSIKANSASG